MDVPQATLSAEVAAASASVDVTLYTTPEARFRAGVEALFSVWSALDAMRENMTGGVETEEKIEDMFEGVLEQFEFAPKFRSRVNQTDLEDMFFDFTENELGTFIEDGSVEQIAEYTFRLFRELERSELGVLKKLLYAQEKRKKTKRKPIVVQTLDPEKSDKPTGVEEQGDDGSEKEGSDADEHEEEEEEEKGDGEEEGDSGKESKDESDGGGWTVVGRKKK